MKISIPPVYAVAGAAVGAAILYAAWQSAKTGKGLAYSIGAAPVDAVNGVIGAAVTTVGGVFGVPETKMTECQKAQAEGRTWDASFACPASDFIKYLFN